MTVKMRFGLFDNPFRQADIKYLGCVEHLELNKEIARESTVLLKNDGILPLTRKKKILVVGASADDIRCNYGDWTYFSHPLPNYDIPPVRPYVTLLEGVKELAKRRDCRRLFEISSLKSRSAWFENGTEKARKQRNENLKRLIKSVFLATQTLHLRTELWCASIFIL